MDKMGLKIVMPETIPICKDSKSQFAVVVYAMVLSTGFSNFYYSSIRMGEVHDATALVVEHGITKTTQAPLKLNMEVSTSLEITSLRRKVIFSKAGQRAKLMQREEKLPTKIRRRYPILQQKQMEP